MSDHPFTNEQLEYLAERDARIENNLARGFKKGFRHFRNAATVGFVILLAGNIGGWITNTHDADQSRHAVVQSGRVVSVSGCNRDYVTVNRLRNVLLNAKTFQAAALKRGDISAEAFTRTQAYYDAQLAGLPQVDCRSSATILTDDPADLPPVPQPLYPPKPPYSGPH